MMGEQQQGGKRAAWRALAAAVPVDHILRRISRFPVEFGDSGKQTYLHIIAAIGAGFLVPRS